MKYVAGSVLTLVLAGTSSLPAQVPLDRADPGIATRDLPRQAPPPPPTSALTNAAPLVGAIAAPEMPVAQHIVVEGAPDLPETLFAGPLASFAGHRLSPVDLQDLLATISGVARAHGYLFARSSLPPQTLADGVLRVRLDEGRLDEIRLTGAQVVAVRRVLAPLLGHAPTRGEVERRLALAGELPGIVLGQAEYRQEGDRGVLVVPVKRDRWTAAGLVDNRGFHELGPVRAQASVTLNGVASERDALTFSALDTIAHPDELAVLSGRYAFHPDDTGTEIALTGSWAHTRPGAELAQYDITGRSTIAGASVSHPLLRSSASSVWLSAEADHIAIDQRLGQQLVRRDRLTTVNVALRGTTVVHGGRLNGGLGVTQGLDILGATTAEDPRSSRPDASGRFTLVGAWANWTLPIATRLSAQLAASGQLATRPLLAVEQAQIGGPTFGRAYDFAERSGDRGAMGSAELDYLLVNQPHGPVRQLFLYGFADAGVVGNLRNDLGTGTLFSAGGGLRATIAFRLQAGFEAAAPLNSRRFATNTRSPRLSFYVARTF
jgi:hemolysin activation/secretion protein